MLVNAFPAPSRQLAEVDAGLCLQDGAAGLGDQELHALAADRVLEVAYGPGLPAIALTSRSKGYHVLVFRCGPQNPVRLLPLEEFLDLAEVSRANPAAIKKLARTSS